MSLWLSQGVITPDGIDLPAGQDYQINNVSVLNATTLGSGVLNSSLTSVGILLDLTVTNTISGSIDGNAGTVTDGVYTTDKISVLSATTSAELAGVISDETGTGLLVFGTGPTIGGTLVYTNAGAGSDPTLSSDSANQDLLLTGNLVVSGDFTVNGTTTFLDTTTLQVEDKNIEMGKVTTPTDITADGGGITLLGSANKTIIWDNANNNWSFNQSINAESGLEYKINNVSVLSATTLGSGVVNSSLTSVGTLSALNVSGDSSLDGAVTINESGADKDFRVESDNIAHALFVRGSNGCVGVGTASPTNPLHVVANTAGHAVRFQNIFDSGELFVGVNSLGKDVFRLNQNSPGDAYFDMRSADGATQMFSLNAGNGLFYCYLNAAIMKDLGIGTTSPTARLHLPAGVATATNAPLKFTTGVALTTPEAGVLEFHNDRLYLTNVAARKVLDRSGDVALSSVIVANTVTETTVYTGVIGTNALKVGNVLKLINSGIISSVSAADVLTMNIYVGSDLAATVDSPGRSLSNDCWHSDGFATLRSVGASGEMAYRLHLQIADNTNTECDVITVDTTGTNDITVKVQWNNAKAGNTFTLQQGIMEYKN